MKYKTTVVFNDGKKVICRSNNPINELDVIDDARILMKRSGLNGNQPIIRIKNKKKFLFFYI